MSGLIEEKLAEEVAALQRIARFHGENTTPPAAYAYGLLSSRKAGTVEIYAYTHDLDYARYHSGERIQQVEILDIIQAEDAENPQGGRAKIRYLDEENLK